MSGCISNNSEQEEHFRTPVLKIRRIHWIRIRIRIRILHFRWIWIQGFDEIEEKIHLKFFLPFLIKNYNLLIPRPTYRTSKLAAGEAFSSQKRTSSNLKKGKINFFFVWVIFAFLDTDPDSKSEFRIRIRDPTESGSNPDPQHCWIPILETVFNTFLSDNNKKISYTMTHSPDLWLLVFRLRMERPVDEWKGVVTDGLPAGGAESCQVEGSLPTFSHCVHWHTSKLHKSFNAEW